MIRGSSLDRDDLADMYREHTGLDPVDSAELFDAFCDDRRAEVELEQVSAQVSVIEGER